MRELRAALKKVAASPNVVNTAVLAKATTIVNETIYTVSARKKYCFPEVKFHRKNWISRTRIFSSG